MNGLSFLRVTDVTVRAGKDYEATIILTTAPRPICTAKALAPEARKVLRRWLDAADAEADQ